MKNTFGKWFFPILAILLLFVSDTLTQIGYAIETTTSTVVTTSQETTTQETTLSDALRDKVDQPTTTAEAEEETESSQSSESTAVYEDDLVTASLTGRFAQGQGNLKVSLSQGTTKEERARDRSFTNQLGQQLGTQSIKIVDFQSLKLSYSKMEKTSEASRFTIQFKEGLTLGAAPLKKENLKFVATNADGTLSFHEPTYQLDARGQLIGLEFVGVMQEDWHVVSVAPLEEQMSLRFDELAEMTFDGQMTKSTSSEDKKQNLKAQLKVIFYHSDSSGMFTITSPIDSFKEVKRFDVLSTWQSNFKLLSVTSENFDIVKINYRQAHTSQEENLLYFTGDFPVSPYFKEGNGNDENILEVYLQNRMPETPGYILGLRRKLLVDPSDRVFRSAATSDDDDDDDDDDDSSQGGSTPGQANITQSKRIDYLGDNGNNPDTSVDDQSGHNRQELYRLYLDMSGTKEPFDTVIVVDRSTSMTSPMSSGDSQLRYKAVLNALNGTNGQAGLLSKLVGFHPDNHVAIVGFQGNPSYSSGQYDSSVIANWGRPTFVDEDDIEPQSNQGTNYTAGLNTAGVLLNQNQSSRTKVMIFISDGVPTYAFKSDGTRFGNGTIQQDNPVGARDYTIQYFNNWIKKYPHLPIYTLGISSEFGNSNNFSANPYVLTTMSNATGGFYSHVSDSQALEGTLQQIVEDSKLSKVSIKDQLNQYVSYYSQQADVVVTRTHRSTGQVTTLYQNGAVTSQGVGIISGVTHTSVNSSDSTGTVQLDFVDNFKIDETYTYTLSFNVQVTDRAYEDKRLGGYNATGDADTDYPGNATSSGKAGFRSNKAASLTYVRNGRPYEHPYQHPVVQVDTRDVTFRKVDRQWTNLTLDMVGFELRLSDKVTVFASGQTNANGLVTFTGLRKGRTYYLYETKAKDGYTLPENPWTVQVSQDGTITVTDQLGKTVSKNGEQHQIVNHKIYQLPSTGGLGPALYIFIGVTVIVTTSYYLFFEKEKYKKEN